MPQRHDSPADRPLRAGDHLATLRQTEIVWQAFKDCPKLKDGPGPEAVQRRKGQKMIEEQLRQEEEDIRKEEQRPTAKIGEMPDFIGVCHDKINDHE